MCFEEYMNKALVLAAESAASGDVPVGCVIVDSEGIVIGEGRNRRRECADATSHAEVEAIRQACAVKGDWRLEGCTLYVTLEPCPMCAGAIINSRISVLVFGCREPLSGSCGSVIDLFSENYGYSPAVYQGVLEDECRNQLTVFFKTLR